MIEGNKRLKIIRKELNAKPQTLVDGIVVEFNASYALISLSFCVIWTDWALLIINGNRNEPLGEFNFDYQNLISFK